MPRGRWALFAHLEGTWHPTREETWRETWRVSLGSLETLVAQERLGWTEPSLPCTLLTQPSQPPGWPRGWRGTCPWDRRQVCSPFFPVPSPSPTSTSERGTLPAGECWVLGAPSRAAPVSQCRDPVGGREESTQSAGKPFTRELLPVSVSFLFSDTVFSFVS